MRKLFAPLLAAVALFALLTGCSSPPLTGLTVELLKIERAADGSATATLRVVNPNVVSYNVESAVLTVFLDGKPAGTIPIINPEGVPAQTTVSVTKPFKTTPGFTLSAGSASYRLEAAITLLLYGDAKEKNKIASSGTVEISTK